METGKPIIWGDPSKAHRTLVYRDGTGVDREVVSGFEMYDVNGRWATILDLAPLGMISVCYPNDGPWSVRLSLFNGLRWAETAPRREGDPGTGRLWVACTFSEGCQRPKHPVGKMEGWCTSLWDELIQPDVDAAGLALSILHERAAAMNPVMRVDDDGLRWVLVRTWLAVGEADSRETVVMVGDLVESERGSAWAMRRGGRKSGYVIATPCDERPTTLAGSMPVPIAAFPSLAWGKAADYAW